MQITYRNKQLEKTCTRRDVAQKKYGEEMAEKLQMRIAEIQAVDSIETMVQWRIGRCHQLLGKRQDQYAVDLVHPFRMIFEQVAGAEEETVKIVEVVDYH